MSYEAIIDARADKTEAKLRKTKANLRKKIAALKEENERLRDWISGQYPGFDVDEAMMLFDRRKIPNPPG